MNKEELVDYINNNREIEFEWQNRKFSITYFKEDNRKFISFCEFYKEPVDVKTIDELFEIKIDNISILDILKDISDDKIYVF